jgi:hypothetical protein
MEAYNQDLLQDTSYHLDNLKINLTRLKILYNRERNTVDLIDDLIKDCELIQLLIRSYDNKNFRLMCDMINIMLLNNPELQIITVDVIILKNCKNRQRSRIAKIPFQV